MFVYRKPSNYHPGGLFSFDAVWVAAYSRGRLIQVGASEIFDTFRIKGSLPKILFSIIIKEQYLDISFCQNLYHHLGLGLT